MTLDEDYPPAGALNKRERTVRKKLCETLNEAGYNAEETFYGLMLYPGRGGGAGFKIVISED